MSYRWQRGIYSEAFEITVLPDYFLYTSKNPISVNKSNIDKLLDRNITVNKKTEKIYSTVLLK